MIIIIVAFYIVVVIAIVALSFTISTESQDSNGWGYLSFISVTIPFGIFLLTEWRHRRRQENEQKKQLHRACKAILREIADNKAIFTTPTYYQGRIEGQNNYIIGGLFSSHAYESLLNSGFNLDLRIATQVALSTLYNRIRLYNETLVYLNHYFDLHTVNKTTDLYPSNAERYVIQLAKWLKEIRGLLDVTPAVVMENL
jgi:hypothetical protein